MTCYVVDASILVKWFVPEVYSEAAIRFLNGNDELIAPDLIFTEAGNALWKKVMRAEIPPTSAKEIIRNLIVSPVKLYPSGSMLDDVAANCDLPIHRVLSTVSVLESRRLVTATSGSRGRRGRRRPRR